MPSRLIGNGGSRGREHREQEQRTLAAVGPATERGKRDQVRRHDQRGQSGKRDGVCQQPIDAGEQAGKVPAARANGTSPEAASAISPTWCGQSATSESATDDELTSAATTSPSRSTAFAAGR